MKSMKVFFLFLLNLSVILSFSQSLRNTKNSDSLNVNFQSLKWEFNKYIITDTSKAKNFAKRTILSAKKEDNNEKLALGYSLLFEVRHNPFYLDSMITVSRNLSYEYRSLSNRLKGNYLYSIGRYSEALKSYLTSREYAVNDIYTYNILNFDIGLLKLELGNYQDAQKLFFDFKKYLENNDDISQVNFVSCLYAIAYTYSKMDKIDSSDHYVKLGLEKNKKTGDKENYSYLLLIAGINSYKRGEYRKSIKTLNRVSKIIRENSFNSQNLALSEFYIGMSYYNSRNSSFLNKFIVVDSIIINSKNVTSELRDVYPKLIGNYKKTGDKDKQLFYINHLLTIDSVLNKNNQVLAKEINKEYDTPILLREKEKLISELDTRSHILIGVIVSTICLLCILIFFYSKRQNDIRNYQYGLDQFEEKIKNEKLLNLKNDPSGIEKNEETLIKPLSKEKLDLLELKFKEFEENNAFLNKNLSLNNLAKDFETNRNYLSKSVRKLKGKSFSQYINELRIQYIVRELDTNPNLRRFTIAGIADEAGYNNSESFTNSFKKITNTLPSHYIKSISS